MSIQNNTIFFLVVNECGTSFNSSAKQLHHQRQRNPASIDIENLVFLPEVSIFFLLISNKFSLNKKSSSTQVVYKM